MNKTNYLLFRFQQGGNSGDVTIAAGSQQYAAAFGDADQRDWRSTGTCFIYVRIYHDPFNYIMIIILVSVTRTTGLWLGKTWRRQ